ncbi:hypothetical protein HY003_03605 [Candidatus Saccharibacteria bacterium]|nr:hypothetical protein [Candidatus Saccharibacteria bacterium]MBI3338358.1 hypothetical protein [Candidatus Saccharibacteria bacterium]
MMHIMDSRKAILSLDRLASATNSFSAFDVSTDTSSSDKTAFIRADSIWEQAISLKSSIVVNFRYWHELNYHIINNASKIRFGGIF